jgi:hypothetical protein
MWTFRPATLVAPGIIVTLCWLANIWHMHVYPVDINFTLEGG